MYAGSVATWHVIPQASIRIFLKCDAPHLRVGCCEGLVRRYILGKSPHEIGRKAFLSFRTPPSEVGTPP